MQESVCRQIVTVKMKQGLHLRPISEIVRIARDYTCDFKISNGDQSGNAKEVIDLLGLQALPETQLVLEANGDDASKLMEEIVQFFESGYKKFEELSDLPD
ncbi:HPr family phosphocarrier protein [Gimesia maris]|jgi:phosphotransferase system HPr (HPr) family protein|uniref:HPr family phosphocarrier protein n=1 Tax=Gimesia maris TaxID=122 RepID=A0A3D3QZW1_9PLAN|nr:HPr family phosphocarrier protein [Gimesia maris]MAC54201.1 HPr family phosphocarrier protein [Gimesia sp.]HAW30874.1 HPr family phosphocarrier protein [Planctomycetaceae bacterium]EDL58542.1 phosphocarrier protein HPr [Gimesia maris DSM 8797]QDT77038.1 Phosphocarrier protein HPr [Gimesia maris]QDU12678.1 Phosphocarrier protein HPr [Gimesia maris]|tara:strand:+ start:311706 stop:312008 length:303 start_codon:yes stop_codon:yes gene_type:complete